MKKGKHHPATTFFLLTAILLLAGMISGCQDKTPKETMKRPVIAGVTITPVLQKQVDDVYEATGTVRSDHTSQVASRVIGVVTSLLVREGDIVKASQVLLTIDDRDATQRVRAADMALESAKQNQSLAQRTWQRYKNLYEEKALSRQEMDQIETQKKVADAEYERAKAMADEARTYLSFTRVAAPVAGRIVRKNIDVGSMAAPGVPLLVIEGGGSSYIEVSIDAGLGAKVKSGMDVEAAIETVDRPLRGEVREVLPAVDPQSRTFTIKVGLRDIRPLSGLFARLRIPLGKKEALLVPDQAIVPKGQLTGVYTVDRRGIVNYRLVRAGYTSAGLTEILSGLVAGDRIITGGIERVIDGGIVTGEKSQ